MHILLNTFYSCGLYFLVNSREHIDTKIKSLVIISYVKKKIWKITKIKVLWIYAGWWPRENKVTRIIHTTCFTVVFWILKSPQVYLLLFCSDIFIVSINVVLIKVFITSTNKVLGHIGIISSVHMSICLFVHLLVCHRNFNLAHICWSINDRALIFGMHDPCDKPFQLPWPWPLTYFKVKFVATWVTTIFFEFACANKLYSSIFTCFH